MLVRALIDLHVPRERRRWERLLRRAGADAHVRKSREKLLERLARQDFDLLVVDRSSLTPSPEAWFAAVRERPDPPEILVVADRENSADRVLLLASGTLAVLPHTLEDASLLEALAAILQRVGEQASQRLVRERPERRFRLDDFVSDSPAMQTFMRLPRRVAASDSTVLILGETGVGKERLARSLHGESARTRGPFLAVNCGALPESLLESELFGHEEGAFTGASRAHRGYFEMAHTGTLFLDEIGEMPLHIQVKLLRVLEERVIRRVGGERDVPVDVRIMAASNRDLEAECRRGAFRTDLFFRLAVVMLEVPPLRDRIEDIPRLVEDHLVRARVRTNSPVVRISPEAVEALVAYHWPGNVRELINVLEQACLLGSGPVLRVEDLPSRISRQPGGGRGARPAEPLPPEVLEMSWPDARVEFARRSERAYLVHLLTRSEGRIGKAARAAGISERSLYELMTRNGIKKEAFKVRSKSEA